MPRPPAAHKLEWVAKKHRWRLRFTWQKNRYDFSNASIPEKAKAQAAYWAEARVQEVKSGRWTETVSFGSDPTAELELVARAFLDERSGGVITAEWAGTQKLHLEKHLLPVFKRLSDVTKASVGSYQAKRLKVVRWATVKKEISTLRQLMAFAEEKGLIADIPHFPKPPKKSLGTAHRLGRTGHTRGLDVAMVKKLIPKLPELSRRDRDGHTWPLRAYFELMYETSLRPTFWSKFRLGIHWAPGRSVLTITADSDKNRWARDVPLTKRAQKVLASVEAKPDGRVFRMLDFRLSLRAAAVAAGLSPEVAARVMPYDMRHQAITRFANSKGGVLGAAYLAGHKQITTTNKYSHANQEHAAKTIASLSGSGGDTGGRPKNTTTKPRKGVSKRG